MPTYADLLSNALAGYGNVMSGYQNALGSQRANQQSILGGYTSLYNNVLGTISGIGESEAQRIEDAYAQQAGQATQDLTNRGLGNTTVSQSVSRGIGLDKAKAKIELANKLAGLKAGYMSNLGLAGLNYGNQANQQDTSLQLSGLGYQAGFQGQQGNWGMQGLGMQNQVGMQNTQLAAQAAAQQAAQQAQWAALQAGFTQQQAMQASQQAFQAAMLQAQMAHQSDMLGAQMANQNQQYAAQQAAQNQLVPNPYYMPQGGGGGGGIPGNQYLTGPGSANQWIGMGGEGFTPGTDIYGTPIKPTPQYQDGPAFAPDGTPIKPGDNQANQTNPVIGIDAQGQPIYEFPGQGPPPAFLPNGTPNPAYAQYITQQDLGNVQGVPGIGSETSQAALDQMVPGIAPITPDPGTPYKFRPDGGPGAVPPPGMLEMLSGGGVTAGRGGGSSGQPGAAPPSAGPPAGATSRPPPVNQASLERPSPSAGVSSRSGMQNMATDPFFSGIGTVHSPSIFEAATSPPAASSPGSTPTSTPTSATPAGPPSMIPGSYQLPNGLWSRPAAWWQSPGSSSFSETDPQIGPSYADNGLPIYGSNPDGSPIYGKARVSASTASAPSGGAAPVPPARSGNQSLDAAWQEAIANYKPQIDPGSGNPIYGPDDPLDRGGYNPGYPPGQRWKMENQARILGQTGADTSPEETQRLADIAGPRTPAMVRNMMPGSGMLGNSGTPGMVNGQHTMGAAGAVTSAPAAPPSGSTPMAYNPGMYGNSGNPWSATGVPTMSAIPGGGYGGGYGGQTQQKVGQMGPGNSVNPGMVNGQYTMGPTPPGMASAYAGAAQGPGTQKAAIPGTNTPPPGVMPYQGPSGGNFSQNSGGYTPQQTQQAISAYLGAGNPQWWGGQNNMFQGGTPAIGPKGVLNKATGQWAPINKNPVPNPAAAGGPFGYNQAQMQLPMYMSGYGGQPWGGYQAKG